MQSYQHGVEGDKDFPLLVTLFMMSYFAATLASTINTPSSVGSLTYLQWEYVVGLYSVCHYPEPVCAFQQDYHSTFFLPNCADSWGYSPPVHDLSIFPIIKLFKDPLVCSSTVQHVNLYLLQISNIIKSADGEFCHLCHWWSIGSGVLCLLATNCMSNHQLLPFKPSNPANFQTI